MKIYSCDFETTTDPADCRVWCWGLMDIDTEEYFRGKTIGEFMKKSLELGGSRFYFHNLKFDGTFILNWLLLNGWEHVQLPAVNPKPSNKFRRVKLRAGQFTTLISDDGKFYSIRIFTPSGNLEILDSLKIIPIPIEQFSKAFGLAEVKGKIDYQKLRSLYYEPSDFEWEYLYHDVHLLRQGLRYLYDQQLTSMTCGANAMGWFKTDLGKEKYRGLFPEIPKEIDKELRKAYRGGYCYVNEWCQGKTIGEGVVYDRNSMYPAEMYGNVFPCGAPVYYKGEYVEDKAFPLYICRVLCRFYLKADHLPTIQLKHSFLSFKETEYLKSSIQEKEDGTLLDEPVPLTLTNIDWVLFQEHYDIEELSFIDGWKFACVEGVFRHYIDFWYHIKENADKLGKPGLKQVAKLMLNNLYGKFGMRAEVGNKIPYLEEGVVKYRTVEAEDRPTVYVPVAVFTTAYARANVIRAGQANFHILCYIDTDSLHISGREVKGIEIDPYKLGAWKAELKFEKARYLRAKCYIEMFHVKRPSYLKQHFKIIFNRIGKCKLPPHYLKLESGRRVYNIHCAGMPQSVHSQVNLDNFYFGARFKGKLQSKNVAGGQVLIEVPFEIKR